MTNGRVFTSPFHDCTMKANQFLFFFVFIQQRDLLLKWKTESNLSTVKSMNVALQKMFTDEFLSRYNIKGSKKQNDFVSYKIIKMFQGT
jgi:hypothetical protein